MKIIHTIDQWYPTFGYQENHFVRVQADAGHEVHVVTSEANSDITAAQEKNYTVHHLASRFRVLQTSARRWLIGLEDKLAELKPDLVIAHGMQSLTSLRVARVAKRPGYEFKLIMDSHADDIVSNRRLRSLYYAAYRLFARPLYLSKSDGLVAINKPARDWLVRWLKIPAEKIEVIGFGADAEKFRRDEAVREQKRSSLGIDDDTVVFVYIGKINPKKAIHHFLDAAFEVGKKRENIAVLVIGGGDEAYVNQLKQQAVAQDKVTVHFIGLVPNDELPDWYSVADVSVWPDWVSIGTYEAQACGLPLIVSDRSPIMEERVSYGNGLVYRRGSVTDLADKMQYLATHPDERARMAASGRTAIEEHLNWKVITDRFMQLAKMRL